MQIRLLIHRALSHKNLLDLAAAEYLNSSALIITESDQRLISHAQGKCDTRKNQLKTRSDEYPNELDDILSLGRGLLDEFHTTIYKLPDELKKDIEARAEIEHRRFILSGLELKTDERPDLEDDTGTHDLLIGLSLSGGGIRSATFSLGVIRSLAKRGFLQPFDFISSVSGGGFASAWLAGYAARSEYGVRSVEQNLLRTDSNSVGPIQWVRKHCSYLAPKFGSSPFSDLWTLIVSYLATWPPIVILILLSLTFVFLLPHSILEIATQIYNFSLNTGLTQTNPVQLAPLLLVPGIILMSISRWLVLCASKSTTKIFLVRKSSLLIYVFTVPTLILAVEAIVLLNPYRFSFSIAAFEFEKNSLGNHAVALMSYFPTVCITYLMTAQVGVIFSKFRLKFHTNTARSWPRTPVIEKYSDPNQTRPSARQHVLALVLSSIISSFGLYIAFDLARIQWTNIEIALAFGPITLFVILAYAEIPRKCSHWSPLVSAHSIRDDESRWMDVCSSSHLDSTIYSFSLIIP